MQKDPSLSSKIKRTEHVRIRKIDIGMDAKASDVSLSNIAEVIQFSREIPDDVDEQFINTHIFLHFRF